MNQSIAISDIAPEELTYEQAIQELETIISTLESGFGNLEESVSMFSRGQALVRRCQNLLDTAEIHVKQLSGEIISDFEG